MAAPFRIPNFPLSNKVEEGELNADAAENASSVVLLNVDGFAVDEPLALGNLGTDACDIYRITGISGKTVSVSPALKRDYRAHEQATQLFGSVFEIYREDNVTTACSIDIADYADYDSVAIQPDQVSTLYTDASGDDTNCYRVTIKNEWTLAETSLSDSAPRRGNESKFWVPLEDIKKTAKFDNNRFIDEDVVYSRRAEAENFVLGVLVAANYPLPFTSRPTAVIGIMRELAAASLHLIDYGDAAEGTTKAWQDRRASALELLKWIVDSQAALIGEDQTTIISRRAAVHFWPTSATKDLGPEEQGGKRNFRITMNP